MKEMEKNGLNPLERPELPWNKASEQGRVTKFRKQMNSDIVNSENPGAPIS